ncbi:TPA: QueT transporter family protein [Streptococcus pyogenes]|uniref:QueT transporter family protein n=1 Tax=Streptococcus pyogenes TaxID=1314 RepID=UPI00109C19AE|nr:QueT transporter family protein [Streptococcus pyogenes]HER6172241.1 QueT transporter family protein [Streptococcus pyogenes]HER6174411.1 QueT transporter family protein [Streptococcus pyogenes]HER6176784.1 QueT transporter family protein [Streptococcus pyogenes]HER6182695.1 QueT transporter family protein [Streptococcus pyogenes]HER6185055.1 QueT transporter family protein [Streptococcus pyogenes]
MTKLTVHDYVHIGLVAALYVVLTITPPLNAISYGMYQFRVSEMMNFLAFYDRKYIIAVTLGCMIANFYSFGLIDVFVGGGSTLIFVTLGVILFSKYQKDYLFNGIFNKAFVYFSFFFATSMLTVAIELYFFGAPFLLTWFTTALGELVSLLIGSLIIDKLSQRISF